MQNVLNIATRAQTRITVRSVRTAISTKTQTEANVTVSFASLLATNDQYQHFDVLSFCNTSTYLLCEPGNENDKLSLLCCIIMAHKIWPVNKCSPMSELS